MILQMCTCLPSSHLTNFSSIFCFEVVERILSRKEHKVDGAKLQVKLYEPPPPPKPRPVYPNRVFVHGFNPETSRDSLENFLEAKAGGTVSEVVFGEEEGTAMVTFEEDPGNVNGLGGKFLSHVIRTVFKILARLLAHFALKTLQLKLAS